MPSFKYSAYTNSGNKEEGVIEADSLSGARLQLKAQALIPTLLKPLPARTAGKGPVLGKRQVSLNDLEFMTSELGILLQNGVKIDRCLAILNRRRGHPAMSELLEKLLASIKQGRSLSQALGDFPQHFDALYINLVRLGEESGNLPEVFQRLSVDLKFRRDLKRKILQSLTYPAVILTVCVLCVLFIFNYIVPQLSGLFDGMPELPVYTAILLAVSSWVTQYQLLLLLTLVVAIAVTVSLLRAPATRQLFDDLLLSVPLLRNAVLIVERIRFNSAAAMMLEAGVSIDKALELSAQSVKNRKVRATLMAAKESIKKGAGLTDTLARCAIYPDFFVSLLEVGEQSGKLAPVFEEIASRSREEFESWTDKLTSLLEPLLIITMALIVGSVVIVMLLSIVSVNDLGF